MFILSFMCDIVWNVTGGGGLIEFIFLLGGGVIVLLIRGVISLWNICLINLLSKVLELRQLITNISKCKIEANNGG